MKLMNWFKSFFNGSNDEKAQDVLNETYELPTKAAQLPSQMLQPFQRQSLGLQKVYFGHLELQPFCACQPLNLSTS